ncbi:MAG: 4-(cytidine 5'-diphospho)-2-C-methyl-D-erythritol kinase [Ruminococcus sp.]|nr:4-(cytidine 5'-diphospho)-2-C-methyl-D-erythritol kinase [Ruminococcus sp.]
MDSITIKAYGKLNLYLDITGRRPDGYHLLRTVMQSVSVHDTLTFEITEGSGIELVCDKVSFPKDNTNLIWTAWERFHAETGIPEKGKLVVTVDKQIPAMAGMAGGSADGAAAITALNRLYGFPYDNAGLHNFAASLGADVPFTLAGGTKLCEGIGDRFTELPPVKGLYFAVVRPDVRVSTPQAYKAYDSRPPMRKKSYAVFANALKRGDVQGMADGAFNALENAVDSSEIRAVKDKLITHGALCAVMTGSGSAVFGIFEERTAAEYCIDIMKEHPFARVLEPIGYGLEIVR